MKTTIRLFLCFVLMGSSSCFSLEQGIPRTLNVRVIGEDGEPIQGAQAKIGFSFVGSTKGLTDAEGTISHFGRQKGSWFVGVNKEGYYHTGGLGPMAAPPDPVEVVLKRKIDPVPMVVGRLANRGILPAQGKEIGYDLKKADWLPPHGSGEIADLYFDGIVRDYSYPDGTGTKMSFDGYLRMRVAGENDGIIIEKLEVPDGSIEPHSELQSMQQAPADGYDLKEIVQTEKALDGVTLEVHRNRHYLLLRTRTRLNEDGEVIRAHYSKVYDPLGVGATRQTRKMDGGQLTASGIFYFNPTPNNRSLEFNKDNLNPNPASRGFAY